MNPDCPKCGARMIGPTYERLHGERLRYACRCGWQETRPTRDAKEAKPLRGVSTGEEPHE